MLGQNYENFKEPAPTGLGIIPREVGKGAKSYSQNLRNVKSSMHELI